MRTSTSTFQARFPTLPTSLPRSPLSSTSIVSPVHLIVSAIAAQRVITSHGQHASSTSNATNTAFTSAAFSSRAYLHDPPDSQPVPSPLLGSHHAALLARTTTPHSSSPRIQTSASAALLAPNARLARSAPSLARRVTLPPRPTRQSAPTAPLARTRMIRAVRAAKRALADTTARAEHRHPLPARRGQSAR